MAMESSFNHFPNNDGHAKIQILAQSRKECKVNRLILKDLFLGALGGSARKTVCDSSTMTSALG